MKTKLDRETMLTKTNIELLVPTYDKYKEFTKFGKFSLPKLLNRAMNLYINDEEFRKTISSHMDLTIWNKNF